MKSNFKEAFKKYTIQNHLGKDDNFISIYIKENFIQEDISKIVKEQCLNKRLKMIETLSKKRIISMQQDLIKFMYNRHFFEENHDNDFDFQYKEIRDQFCELCLMELVPVKFWDKEFGIKALKHDVYFATTFKKNKPELFTEEMYKIYIKNGHSDGCYKPYYFFEDPSEEIVLLALETGVMYIGEIPVNKPKTYKMCLHACKHNSQLNFQWVPHKWKNKIEKILINELKRQTIHQINGIKYIYKEYIRALRECIIKQNPNSLTEHIEEAVNSATELYFSIQNDFPKII